MANANPTKLNTIDGETLMSKPLQPLNFVVDTLLSQGLHILAGSPKVGKSWLALWLAVMVAKGEPVWGMPVKGGTTLYLCLEDSQLRIQNRLFDVTEDAPANVHFCTESRILGDGLTEQLEQFLAEHPDTSLIITYTTPKGKKCRDDRLHEDKYRKEVMECEFRIREEMLRRRIEGEEPAARASSFGGGVGRPAGDSRRPVPPDGDMDRYSREYPLNVASDEYTDGEADQGSGDDPSTAGAERTGWEEERAQAFASAPGDPAPPQSGLALGRPDLAGTVGDLVQWGRHMEQSAEAVPPVDPVTAHSDRKALAKEREKKIALGHKPDDHEEQNITLSM